VTDDLALAQALSARNAGGPHRMSDAPPVTVIMAAYNCEDYIAEAVESVIAQTYPHWELLCIDDCSTDGTRDVIARYVSADDRVRLLCNEENMGAAATRNRGIEAARGEYVAILDADDVSMPDRLERSLAAFRDHPEVVLVGSGARLIDGSGADKGIWHKHRLVHSSVMVSRDTLAHVGGYDEFFRYGHDVDLYLRLSLLGPFCILGEPMVKYRRHGTGISLSHSIKQAAYGELAIERYRARREDRHIDLSRRFAELVNSPAIEAGCNYDHGWSRLLCGDTDAARRHFARAKTLTPRRLTAWLWYALSLLPSPCLKFAVNAWFATKRRILGQQTGVVSWTRPGH